MDIKGMSRAIKNYLSFDLITQAESKKQDLITQATNDGKLDDPGYLAQVDFLNGMIKIFRGDSKTEKTS